MTDDQAPSTDTLESARAHARSLADADAPPGLTVPAAAAGEVPDGVAAERLIWHEQVPGGNYASRRLPRGAHLRLVDLEGDACAALVLHRAEHPLERLNVADTVKVQWQAYLGAGALLLSDMGRALATIVEDDGGTHDALCGCTNRASVGAGGAWSDTPNGRDLLCLGLAKHGLSRADLPPNVNLFVGVRVDDDGTLRLDPSVVPGAAVTLRAELDLLVTIANVTHPLDRRGVTATPLQLTAWTGEPAGSDDPARTSTPERARALLNNDELLAGGAR